MRRRRFLAALAVGGFGASAGCRSPIGDRSSELRLGWYAVANYDTEPHSFALRVDRDGETVHRSRHDVPGRSDAVVHSRTARCTWGDVPGEYTLAVRRDGGEWDSERLVETTAGRNVACAAVSVTHGEPWIEDGFDFRLRGDCSTVAELDGGCGFASSTATE